MANRPIFASIFGTVNECTEAIEEISDEFDFDVTEVGAAKLDDAELPALDEVGAAIQKVDAVQYSSLSEEERNALTFHLEVREVSAGAVLTTMDAPCAGLHLVLSPGPAVVDDHTGEIVSSGALIDMESLTYNATTSRSTMRAGAEGCRVALLPVAHFDAWSDIRARLIHEAVPLFRSISTEKLLALPMTHDYVAADATVSGVMVITSGVLIARDDSGVRLFSGHILGVREMLDEKEGEAHAETRAGVAIICKGDLNGLINTEMNFAVAVGESIFQRCVVTEVRMKRQAQQQRLTPPHLTRTQSILTHSSRNDIILQRKVVLSQDAKEQSCINEYKVLRRLGEGATAAVYLCGVDGGVDVAIKAVSRHSSGQSLKREIDALRNLSHVNIITLLEIIDDLKCEKVFLVEEYAQGGCMTGVTLGLRDGQRCALDCLQGLKYMHSRGYVHRDVKPANIVRMLDGTVKLADFGCSIKVGGQESMAFAGTPAFMAPELCVGAKITPKVDVWAFTASLHCIIYGKPPFSSYKRVELEGDIMYRPPSTGDAAMPTFTGDEVSYFKNLCMQGLTKDPDARITVRDLLKHPWIRSGR